MIKEKFNLINKVAIITGASKGIGESMARGLAEFGAKVVISSRKQQAVDEVASKFNLEGLSAMKLSIPVLMSLMMRRSIKVTSRHSI